MFLSALPLPSVLLHLAIVHGALPMPLVVEVISFVFFPIRPLVGPMSVLQSFAPSSHIPLPLAVGESAHAIYFVILKLPIKHVPVLDKDSIPMLFVVQELAYVPATIGVGGFSDPIREIIFPLSLVSVPLHITKPAMPIRLVILDLPFVVAAIRLYYPAFSLAAPIDESSFQVIIVLEVHFAESVRLPIHFLAHEPGPKIMVIGFFLRPWPAPAHFTDAGLAHWQ